MFLHLTVLTLLVSLQLNNNILHLILEGDDGSGDFDGGGEHEADDVVLRRARNEREPREKRVVEGGASPRAQRADGVRFRRADERRAQQVFFFVEPPRVQRDEPVFEFRRRFPVGARKRVRRGGVFREKFEHVGVEDFHAGAPEKDFVREGDFPQGNPGRDVFFGCGNQGVFQNGFPIRVFRHVRICFSVFHGRICRVMGGDRRRRLLRRARGGGFFRRQAQPPRPRAGSRRDLVSPERRKRSPAARVALAPRHDPRRPRRRRVRPPPPLSRRRRRRVRQVGGGNLHRHRAFRRDVDFAEFHLQGAARRRDAERGDQRGDARVHVGDDLLGRRPFQRGRVRRVVHGLERFPTVNDFVADGDVRVRVLRRDGLRGEDRVVSLELSVDLDGFAVVLDCLRICHGFNCFLVW